MRRQAKALVVLVILLTVVVAACKGKAKPPVAMFPLKISPPEFASHDWLPPMLMLLFTVCTAVLELSTPPVLIV